MKNIVVGLLAGLIICSFAFAAIMAHDSFVDTAMSMVPQASQDADEERIAKANVSNAMRIENQLVGWGTGVIIAGRNLLLTDWHVVDEVDSSGGLCATHLAWKQAEGRKRRYERVGECLPMQVVRVLPDSDLALLRPADANVQLRGGVRLSTETPGIGTKLFKFGVTTDVSSGRVLAPFSTLKDTVPGLRPLTVLMRAAEGDSGGPVLTADGLLVGLVHQTSQSGNTTVISSPEDLRDILQEDN